MIRIHFLINVFICAVIASTNAAYCLTADLQSLPLSKKPNFGDISFLKNYIIESESIIIGLQVNLNDGWKSYWRHSGDTGLPTRIVFKNIDALKTQQYYGLPQSLRIVNLAPRWFTKMKILFP